MAGHCMAEKALIKRWVEKAEEDLGYASLSLEQGFSFFPQICWHFQQAAEKYLKAYILACELEFRKIHDLVALLKICQAHEPSLESLFESCTYLQRFYVETRYPVAWEVNYSLEDTLKAQNATQQIKEFITKHLPPL